MAAQGERVSEAIVRSSVLDPMAQNEEVEQEMLVVEEQEQFFPPQMDSEPEMGAAAAYDTSPPPLHQTPRSWPSRLSRAHSTWPS